jgi:hypothetical protein
VLEDELLAQCELPAAAADDDIAATLDPVGRPTGAEPVRGIGVGMDAAGRALIGAGSAAGAGVLASLPRAKR